LRRGARRGSGGCDGHLTRPVEQAKRGGRDLDPIVFVEQRLQGEQLPIRDAFPQLGVERIPRDRLAAPGSIGWLTRAERRRRGAGHCREAADVARAGERNHAALPLADQLAKVRGARRKIIEHDECSAGIRLSRRDRDVRLVIGVAQLAERLTNLGGRAVAACVDRGARWIEIVQHASERRWPSRIRRRHVRHRDGCKGRRRRHWSQPVGPAEITLRDLFDLVGELGRDEHARRILRDLGHDDLESGALAGGENLVRPGNDHHPHRVELHGGLFHQRHDRTGSAGDRARRCATNHTQTPRAAGDRNEPGIRVAGVDR
jgi:hypothetical protein